MTNPDICPNCGQQSLPRIEPGSMATAVACQNPKCGQIFEKTELGHTGKPPQATEESPVARPGDAGEPSMASGEEPRVACGESDRKRA